MITNQGKRQLCLCIMGNSSKRIARIGFGTSQTPTTELNTVLTDPYIRDIINCRYDEVTDEILVDWILEPSEANNKTIREIGLYTADDTLITRRVREPIVKTDDIQLTGLWHLKINLS